MENVWLPNVSTILNKNVNYFGGGIPHPRIHSLFHKITENIKREKEKNDIKCLF